MISFNAERLLLSISPTSDMSLFRLRELVTGLTVSSAMMIVEKQCGAIFSEKLDLEGVTSND